MEALFTLHLLVCALISVWYALVCTSLYGLKLIFYFFIRVIQCQFHNLSTFRELAGKNTRDFVVQDVWIRVILTIFIK